MTTRKNNPIYIMLVAYRQGKMTEDFIHFDSIVAIEALYDNLRYLSDRIHHLEIQRDNEGFYVDNSKEISCLHRLIGNTVFEINDLRDELQGAMQR